MSRDLVVQDIPGSADTVDELPEDWMPAALPFGRSQVIAAVVAVAPSADFSDVSWGHVELPGVDVEINVPAGNPLMSFAFHSRGIDKEATDRFLRAVLERLGVRAFDPASDGGIFPR